MGIILSLLALLFWGLGDFFIQKSARKVGVWQALFFDNFLLVVVLSPFVVRFFSDFQNNFSYLIIAGVVTTVAAWLDFSALKNGKICVVEPIYALEIPVTVGVSALLIGEFLNPWQLLLVSLIFLGILFVTVKNFKNFLNYKLEKGVILALAAAISMGLVNFFFGDGARKVNPLGIVWAISFFMMIISIGRLWMSGQWRGLSALLIKNKSVILSEAFFNNVAWVAFAGAALFIPIAIATSISESYIALAAGLGLIFNREKLRPHQIIGLVVVVAAVVLLARIS